MLNVKKEFKTLSQATLKEYLKENKISEGLVVLGAGGDLQELVDVISKSIKDVPNLVENQNIDVITNNIFKVEGEKDTITYLVMELNPEAKINISMLAMWRLRMEGITWISDFVEFNI